MKNLPKSLNSHHWRSQSTIPTRFGAFFILSIYDYLGYRTKTTEIYTHVSTKNLQAIKSPIEEMQL